jgi:hypothetical protein
LPSAASSIEWDLDGNGSFETTTGTGTTAHASFTVPGRYQLAARGVFNAEQLVASVAVIVRGWRHTDPMPDNTPGRQINDNSLAIIAGHPAVAYHDSAADELWYVSATDPDGLSWGTPVKISNRGPDVKLIEVHGAPAVGYDGPSFTVEYRRATDASGTAWASPVEISNSTPFHTVALLTAADGDPQIAYYDNGSQTLKFRHATDPNGDTWSTPVEVDPTLGAGYHCAATLVQGHPAIAYFEDAADDIRYRRAADPDGLTWGSEEPINSLGSVGAHPSFVVIDGFPAVAYSDFGGLGQVAYQLALDSLGTEWGQVRYIGSENESDPTLASIGGVPYISFTRVGIYADSFIARATDPAGAAWEVEKIAMRCAPTTLASVNGRPGLALSQYLPDGSPPKLGFARLY